MKIENNFSFFLFSFIYMVSMVVNSISSSFGKPRHRSRRHEAN